MFLLLCLLLGFCGIGLSRMLYRSFLSPLGLYSLAWVALVTLHQVVSSSNPGLYYDLDAQTMQIVVAAWVAWIVGCLLARIGHQPQGAGDGCDRKIDIRRLRLLLVALSFAASVCVMASLIKLARAGVLFQPGDAWREAHFTSARDLFDRGLIYDLAVMISQGALYVGTSLGVYAVVRHRFSTWFAIVPAFFGLTYDLSIAGRFWITQAPVLMVVAFLLSSGRHSSTPRPLGNRAGRDPFALPSVERKGRSLLSSTKTLITVGVVTFASLVAIAQLRVGVKQMNERGLKIGQFEMTNVLVGPTLYATDTLGLLNSYTSSQHNWETTNGKLFAGGAFYLANIPALRILKLDVGGEVWDYVVASDELLPIGYQRRGQFFTSYLVPATADFGLLGVALYPLLAAFIFSKIYQHAVRGQSLLSIGLYPLVAVWVVFTVMRWELVAAPPWISMGMLLVSSLWVTSSRAK